MFVIQACPLCGTKLRYPIDKGKIRVSCSCGHSFVADPDDPSLYRSAQFDLKDGKRKGASPLSERLSQLSLNDLKVTAIERAMAFKYKLQNFRLLPKAEQRKFITRIAIILMVLFLFIYLLSLLNSPPVSEKII